MALSSNGVAKLGGNSKAAIKGFVKQILDVEYEIQAAKDKHLAPLQSHMKDIYSAAGGEGFDKKAMKECVRQAKMSDEDRFEADAYALAWFDDYVAPDDEKEEDEL